MDFFFLVGLAQDCDQFFQQIAMGEDFRMAGAQQGQWLVKAGQGFR